MKNFLGILFLFSSLSLFAEDVKIKAIELRNDKGAENHLSIKLTGNLNDNPQISVNDKILQITIPKAHVAGKIQKNFNGSIVTASQMDRDTVSVKAVLPYSLQGKESLVNITLKEGSFDVSFPRGVGIVNQASSKEARSLYRAPGVVAQVNNNDGTNAEAEKLDESYLSNLVKENEKLAEEKHPEQAKSSGVTKGDHADTTQKDGVNLTQASLEKTAANSSFNKEVPTKSNFSLSAYIGKFVAFLSLMILGFYGVLTMFKKGVIKKGKLGFLHSTKMVEVLSTTHVAPKRTLMMVKAHKQVFLISNTEGGISLISEIQDVTGLIKTGEEEVSGSNFDTNLYSANRASKEFKLKEDSAISDYSLDDMLAETNDESNLDKKQATNAAKAIEKSPVKDQVRFSDQIKTKLKHMKQIQ